MRFHTNVIMAMLPSDAVEDEHMTLVYAGDINQVVTAPLSVMNETANRLSHVFQPFMGHVVEHAVFGPKQDTEVAIIHSPMVQQIRHCVEHFHHSQFGLQPHMSKVGAHPLRPVGSVVWFNRIACWYGESRQEWRLGSGGPLHSM